jgi:hypothetical protein
MAVQNYIQLGNSTIWQLSLYWNDLGRSPTRRLMARYRLLDRKQKSRRSLNERQLIVACFQKLPVRIVQHWHFAGIIPWRRLVRRCIAGRVSCCRGGTLSGSIKKRPRLKPDKMSGSRQDWVPKSLIYWSGREDSNLRPPHPQCEFLRFTTQRNAT